MALATCCHHCCEWNEYVNRDFFLNGGFTEHDFNAILRMTGWATAGFGKAKTSTPAAQTTTTTSTSSATSGAASLELSDAEKIKIGERCKTILDVGRLLYLSKNGFSCEIVQYIDKKITPENRLLVGRAV